MNVDPNIPLGHSIPSHRTFGWCSHCPDRTSAEELGAWQIRELRRLVDETTQPTARTSCGCPSENAVEHQFGGPDCECVPFTRQDRTPRYCQPGDTVDQISGWEIGRNCPHHRNAPAAPAVVAQPDEETDRG